MWWNIRYDDDCDGDDDGGCDDDSGGDDDNNATMNHVYYWYNILCDTDENLSHL